MPAQNVSNINVKVDLIFPTVLGLNLPTFWYNHFPQLTHECHLISQYDSRLKINLTFKE